MKHQDPKNPPWKTAGPKRKTTAKKLTPEEIEMARERAAAAGRRYPNLVDNMAILKQRKQQGFLP